MFLKKIEIDHYKVLENISINFEKREQHNVFPVISANGGGKSTLLQFVFCFLHCAFKAERQEYLKNLLDYYTPIENKDELNRLVKFELEYNGKDIHLEFFLCKNDYKDLDFDAILTLQSLDRQRDEQESTLDKITGLNLLKKELTTSRSSMIIIKSRLKKIFTYKNKLHQLNQLNDIDSSNRSELLSIIDNFKDDLETSLLSENDFKKLETVALRAQEVIHQRLEQQQLQYLFHANDDNILLYQSNINSDILNEISDKIYLAVPNTQVLHFLEHVEIETLFSNYYDHVENYEDHLNTCQESLTGLYTYDFSAINLVFEAYQQAKDADFKQALETGEYGNQLSITKQELNNVLTDKTVTIDGDFKQVTFKSTKSGSVLSPKDLSHGELKKLAIYIWLKAKTSENSLILMDEVDMGLHPNWQHDIYNDLQKWSEGSQFLLATHSPQIISKAFYKNLVVITPTETGATAEQFSEAPLESDLNTVVKTIMGGEYVPKELLELRKKYRALFEKNELETQEAKDIKGLMLAYESENSSFFQGIKFEMAFR